MKKLLDMVKPVIGIAANPDIFNGGTNSDVVNTSLYGEVVFALIVTPDGTGTGTGTIVVKCSAAADGSSATAVAGRYRKVDAAQSPVDKTNDYVEFTSAGFTTVAGETAIYLVEVRPEDLTSGKPFVFIDSTEVVNNPVYGACLVLCGAPRYAAQSLPSAIS